MQLVGIYTRRPAAQIRPLQPGTPVHAMQALADHTGQIDVLIARQAFGHLADLLALAVVLFAVGKRGQQADGEGGADFFSGHGKSWSVWSSKSALERERAVWFPLEKLLYANFW